jgi:hypothetical protein
MSDVDTTVVPFWTLSTADTPGLPAVSIECALSPGRLAELRSALATFSAAPLVTLEAHPLPKERERTAGLPLDALSPLEIPPESWRSSLCGLGLEDVAVLVGDG